MAHARNRIARPFKCDLYVVIESFDVPEDREMLRERLASRSGCNDPHTLKIGLYTLCALLAEVKSLQMSIAKTGENVRAYCFLRLDSPLSLIT